MIDRCLIPGDLRNWINAEKTNTAQWGASREAALPQAGSVFGPRPGSTSGKVTTDQEGGLILDSKVSAGVFSHSSSMPELRVAPERTTIGKLTL